MMEIGSTIDILRTLPDTIALKPGDLLNVNVLKVFDDQRALVDLGRFRTMAAVSFPVAAGAELRVRVIQTHNQLRLQLVPTPAEPGSAAEPAAGPAQALSAASLKQIQAEMAADIRAGQGPMAHPAAAAEPFQTVHLTLPMTGDRPAVQLKIAHPRRRPAGTPKGHRAAILLQLDRMGAVRADLMLLGRSLNVSIFVSAPELRHLVTRHASEVREALSAFFETIGVQVAVSPQRIAQFAAEDWRLPGETQVDVRV